MTTKKISCLLISLLLLCSNCKKGNDTLDPLSYVIVPKQGIIRVECAECTFNYTVLDHTYAIQVKNSQDIPYSYISNFELKTAISAVRKQVVRLTILDAYGRIISNELNGINAGDQQTDSFKIKID
jgi:hypothetical protein